MATDIDGTMGRIQDSIIEEVREKYPEKVVEFWLNPRFMGEISNPDGYAKVTGTCGDTIQIFLKIEKGIITDARFLTDGCGATVAVGCMACELAAGKSPKEAFQISEEVLLKELGGLPEENTHCALLASNTLKAALIDYITSGKKPWE